mmetsp:Transcript_4166/g.10118  ORF Transcript_4166/g.10118 Transcript_4166/m.10118 type:complete len:267 (-) Transcript_4166:114-914(-)
MSKFFPEDATPDTIANVARCTNREGRLAIDAERRQLDDDAHAAAEAADTRGDGRAGAAVDGGARAADRSVGRSAAGGSTEIGGFGLGTLPAAVARGAIAAGRSSAGTAVDGSARGRAASACSSGGVCGCAPRGWQGTLPAATAVNCGDCAAPAETLRTAAAAGRGAEGMAENTAPPMTIAARNERATTLAQLLQMAQQCARADGSSGSAVASSAHGGAWGMGSFLQHMSGYDRGAGITPVLSADTVTGGCEHSGWVRGRMGTEHTG